MTNADLRVGDARRVRPVVGAGADVDLEACRTTQDAVITDAVLAALHSGGQLSDRLGATSSGLFEDAFEGGAIKHLLLFHLLFGHLLFIVFAGYSRLDVLFGRGTAESTSGALVVFLFGHLLLVHRLVLAGRGGGLGLCLASSVVRVVIAAAARSSDKREREQQRQQAPHSTLDHVVSPGKWM